jgi:twinkle protein
MSGALVDPHQPCPHCGSSDAASLYDNGEDGLWWKCFSCGKSWPGDAGTQRKASSRMSSDINLSRPKSCVFKGLPDRGLAEATLKRFGYYVDDETGNHWATYTNPEGHRVAYKIRTPDKKFSWQGKNDEHSPLFGQALWSPKQGKMIVVTEGEIDAMSVAQLQGLKWPVVSVENGAQAAAGSVAKALPYLTQFEKVVLLFDNDKPGKDAAHKAAAKLPPGKAYIAKLPSDLKDANAALTKGRGQEVISAIHGAEPYLPGGIVSADSLIDTLDDEPETGSPWRLKDLTKWTYGRRRGETIVIGGATSSGKTDLLYDEMAHTVFELGEPIGVFSWESDPKLILRHLMGKAVHKRLHIPDPDDILWTKADLAAAKQLFHDKAHGKVFMNDSFGVSDLQQVLDRIRYLAHAHGVLHVVLDPLTALAAGMEDERRGLDQAMAAIASLSQELNITIYIVSHLTTADEGAHEEGARVMVKHLRGSRAIGYWAHCILGIERDQQDQGSPTTVRLLKNRIDGSKVGSTCQYAYDLMTGQLEPCELPDYGQHTDGD